MAYRIGIDAGSKTIKLVALDEDGKLVHHIYWRHRSNIRKTLTRMLEELSTRAHGIEGCVAITGSAGISLAKALRLPFVQEVIATTEAVQERFPDADAIIELGGEDAKVVYLSGQPEQRMNATCAGGTGGFIDTIAFMLGVRTQEMNQLARRSSHVYPIASRCAVFAQTDVRPLLNAGARKEDIAASALEAVVRQSIGGLACGRPIRGKVVFLGGPFEYLSELSRRFRMALELDEHSGIRPQQAHLFTARGTALAAGRLADEALARGEEPGNLLTMAALADLVAASEYADDDLPRLEPLFADEAEQREFEERHAKETMPRGSLFSSEGPLYLGFDAGSTTVKYALVNEAGELVSSAYRATDGDVLDTACTMLGELYELLPADGPSRIAQAIAIGYGDELLRAALRLDADVVETAAHLRAARAFRPDASFVLDIGGQDMKALWVRDGQVVDAVLNEACSSGCGSFVEGTAHSMRLGPMRFSKEALRAKAPLELGTKCTVFMTSRVRHAQKIGAPVADIAAGIAYSVVLNALHRVIGRDKSAQMGDVVVVQGGTFKSDVVLRAFEKVAGVEAVRPDTAHLMGAIGAALIARDRAHEMRESAARRADAHEVASSIVDAEELEALEPRYANLTCEGCPNACALSVVGFGDGRAFVSGNRCGRGADLAREQLERDATAAGGEQHGVAGSHAGGAGSERAAQLAAAHERRRKAAAAKAKRGDARASADNGGDGARVNGGAAESKPKAVRHVTIKVPRRPGALKGSDKVPNVLGDELTALAGYGARAGRKELAHVKIGIETTLDGYELRPFWHSFLSYLGFTIVEAAPVAPGETCRLAQALPDAACEPVKLAHAHVEGFARAGANAVFLPRYRKGLRCQGADDYLTALCDAAAADDAARMRLVSPILRSLRPEKIPRDEQDIRALADALGELAGEAAPTRHQLLDALRLAWREQIEFEKAIVHGVDHAATWMTGTPGHCAVAVACRPCHADPALLQGIDRTLRESGLSALPALGLEHVTRRRLQGAGANKFDPADSGMPVVHALHSDMAWTPAERLAHIAEYAAAEDGVGLIVLESAHCEHAVNAAPAADAALEGVAEKGRRLQLEQLGNDESIKQAAARLSAEIVKTRKAKTQEEADEKRTPSRGDIGAVVDCHLPAVPVGDNPLRHQCHPPANYCPPAPRREPLPYLPTARVIESAAHGTMPNVVAREQALLARYTSTEGGLRADVRIGLPATLSGYELLPFWHTLLAELGFTVLVANAPETAAQRSASAESVPSESVCEPAKLTHARLYALREAGANAVLMPRYERASRCAVLCGYACAVHDSVPFVANGTVALIAPTLRATHPTRMQAQAHDLDELFVSLQGRCTELPLERSEFDAAFAAALVAQETFERTVRTATQAALALMEHDPTMRGIVLAGRPYHMDPALLHGIDEVLVKLGFTVLPALGLGEGADEPGFATEDPDGDGENAALQWKPAKRLLRLACSVVEHPKLDLVALQSFGCGYDAVTLGDVRELLVSAGRPFTALKIDEIVDTAHIRIRLRTMAESIAAGKREAAGESGGQAPRFSGSGASNLRPSTHSTHSDSRDLFAARLTRAGLETARAIVPADICFTAAATTAHAINLLREHPGTGTLHAPRVCRDCVVDALPHLLRRACGHAPSIVWHDSWNAPTSPASNAEANALKVGLVGNPLLCFDAFMNEGVVDLLEELGARAVLPDPDKLFTDDVRYLDQLDEFARNGVDLVLYLQSFGCLKGHVHARGALHELAARYPDMPVTVLDYDPESSALNRENRIRLAVSAARKRL